MNIQLLLAAAVQARHAKLGADGNEVTLSCPLTGISKSSEGERWPPINFDYMRCLSVSHV